MTSSDLAGRAVAFDRAGAGAPGPDGSEGEAAAWLDRVATLEPLVQRLRDQAEAERRLPAPLVDALRDAGLFGLWVPHRLGGAELGLETAVRVVEAVSRLDGSVGWNVMIAANTAILWGDLDPDVAAAMTAAGAIMAGTITSGAGTAAPVPGGYRVSGRWPFASGCHQADWLVAVCSVPGDEAPADGSGGRPVTATFALPAAACEILDTWDTVGMRATGSHDFTAQDVFVPDGQRLAPHGRGAETSPLYTTNLVHVWAPNIAGVALGIARDALDSFTTLARTKKAALAATVLAERETVQDQLGRAEAQLRAGRAFLYETIRATWARVATGEQVPADVTALSRLAAASAVEHAINAVDIAFELAGSTSVYHQSRLERCFRDVHVVRQHAVVGPSGFAGAGRSLLGVSPVR